MSIEATIFATIKSLVDDRVYRDITPANKRDLLPRITFQQVGGRAINFMGGEKPSKKNARIQINCWAARRDDATALARLVEDALRAQRSLSTTVLEAAVSVFEAGAGPGGTDLYGTVQDFDCWYDD